MSKKNFISFLEFSEKHGISAHTIHTSKFNGVLPSFIFCKKNSGRTLLIEENFFLRRETWLRKVWLDSHDNYFFLTSKCSSTELSIALNKIDPSVGADSWNSFLSTALFQTSTNSIVNYKLAPLRYKFYRYTRWIIQMLFRTVRVPVDKRDLGVILDRL